jgi:hypothetical protein
VGEICGNARSGCSGGCRDRVGSRRRDYRPRCRSDLPRSPMRRDGDRRAVATVSCLARPSGVMAAAWASVLQ